MPSAIEEAQGGIRVVESKVPPKAKFEEATLFFRLATFVLIIVMLAILLGALSWRATVVRHFPQTASLYTSIGLPVNLRGLFFESVKSRNEFEDGTNVLVIEGTIVNLTTRISPIARSTSTSATAPT